MVSSESILLFVCGLGILQGILLASLIYFHAKSDRTVNKFLALYIVFVSVIMTFPFILRIFSWQNSFVQQPIPLLTGPLLYLYLRSFKESITWQKALPHFLLFFLFYVPTYLHIKSLAAKYPNADIVPAEMVQHPITIALNYLKFTQSLVYYFLAYKTLKSYQRSIQQIFSETSRIDLHWTSILIHGYLIMVLTAIVIFSLMLRYPEQFNLLFLIIVAVASPYIYIVTYKGILQPTIWQLNPKTQKETVEIEIHQAEVIESSKVHPEKPKYQKTGLSEGKVEEIAAKVVSLMEQQKLYHEAELTLQQLADKLQYPSYQVSQAINDGLKKNFYDLVNSYRVEEAKRLLLDPKSRNYTILSVGLDAGFNSKTTFNTVFKKFTGMTPTDFRERQTNQVLV